MKDYMRPEIERINFAAEEIATGTGVVSIENKNDDDIPAVPGV